MIARDLSPVFIALLLDRCAVHFVLYRLVLFLLPFKLSRKTLSIMADQKLRCALAYRLESGGSALLLSKYDHASQYESHGGAAGDETTLYGGRDKSYAEAVAAVIQNDPPSGLGESGQIGGFKVVQSDQHQVVYGADMEGVCK